MADNYLSTPVGLAMVNRMPLDKYSKFNSLQELISYKDTGPVYDGQVVSVDGMQYVIKYYNNKFRILPIYNNAIEQCITTYGELVSKEGYKNEEAKYAFFNANVALSDSSKLLLVYNYNHNFTSKTFSNNDCDIGICYDAFSYSLMKTIELYRETGLKKCFKFIIVLNDNIGAIWEQYINPYSSYNGNTGNSIDNYGIRLNTADQNFVMSFVVNGSISQNYGLFPRNTDKQNSISLYIVIDDYLK